MKKSCEVCGESGQISYFKGVSRFLLSWEDCPECGGMGFKIDSNESAEPEEEKGNRRAGPKKKEKS